MCGIAGYVGREAHAHVDRVRTMLGVIAHRGPDDEGVWSDELAVLGHRRLSIIDTSAAGHQPMHSHCGRYVLTYNGEIYNYIELKEELEAEGIRFTSHSDSEVLLAAFTAWGERCVEKFNGMWAFAIWDRQDRRLFVSRDRFGEKPFYYVSGKDGFWFASEIKALLEIRVAERAVNPAALADFAADRISDHTSRTFFSNVMQLTPATSGWLTDGRLALAPYWSLPAASHAPISGQFADEVGALLEDSIRLRLRSDVAVGVLLSGGLDSSSVACLAAMQGEGLAAFSTIDRQPPEEARGIEQVAAMHRGLTLHVDTPPEDTLEVDLAECLWFQEEPFADGSMLAHFRLMRRARQEGIRVLLTGQAADEVFAGYPGFQPIHVGGLIRAGKWGEAIRYVRAMRATGQPVPLTGMLGHALPTRIARMARKRRANSGLDWIAEEFRVDPEAAGGYAMQSTDAVNTALRECLQRRTIPAFLHYEDRNAMAFGVETRIPFLDHRLVEKVLPVSGAAKLAGGRTKALLRDAVAGKVPPQIVSRLAKQGYPAPLSRWLKNADPGQRGRYYAMVAASPLIDSVAWRRRADALFEGDDSQLPAVWRGLVIAAWHEKFIGSPV